MKTSSESFRVPSLAALLLLFVAVLFVAPAGADAASRGLKLPPSISPRATVPVLAEAGGASLGERLRGAKVRAYAVAPQKRGDARRRLVGRGRTGRLGVATLLLRERHRPRHLLVVVSGGKLLGKPFGGHMKARVTGQQAAFV